MADEHPAARLDLSGGITLCPHGVSKKTWDFWEKFSPHVDGGRGGRLALLLSHESCPGCLQERVETLRGQLEVLAISINRAAFAGEGIGSLVAAAERALTVVRDDKKTWSKP